MGYRVLILSATTGYQLRSFNDAAATLGIELVFATDRCHQLDDPWLDRAIPVRFHEPRPSLDAILRRLRQNPVDGVLAVGDRPTILAARVAETLGLPGNPPDAAAASGNKRETRSRFAAAGLPVPWYFTVPLRSVPEAVAADRRVQYPCVLKPLGLSGSRGVIRANTPRDFVTAFERIRALLMRVDVRAARTGLEDAVLVEGFIPGREFAIEGVLTEGALHAFAIFDKPDPLDGPFFEETIYVTPSMLDRANQTAMTHAVQAAAEALGLRHGAVHAECRLGPRGVVVLEVAPRPIGGLCSKVLEFTPARSLEELLLRHAIGEDVTGYALAPGASAVMMIPIPQRGILKRVEGEERARRVPGITDVQITAKQDQLLEPLPEAGSYLGFIFARGQSPQDAEAAVRQAHGALRFLVDAALNLVT